jgi:hypothetical protein
MPFRATGVAPGAHAHSFKRPVATLLLYAAAAGASVGNPSGIAAAVRPQARCWRDPLAVPQKEGMMKSPLIRIDYPLSLHTLQDKPFLKPSSAGQAAQQRAEAHRSPEPLSQ